MTGKSKKSPQSDTKESTNNLIPKADQAEDGRDREWQDRARVNLEQVPEGTKTFVERDFEPVQTDKKDSEKDNVDPVY